MLFTNFLQPIQASFTVPVVIFKDFAAPLINNAPPPNENDDNKYSAGNFKFENVYFIVALLNGIISESRRIK